MKKVPSVCFEAMDENSALIEAILREQEEEDQAQRNHHYDNNNNNNNNNYKKKQNDDEFGWKTVSYKRNKKASNPKSSPEDNSAADLLSHRSNGAASNVFSSIEKQSEERRQRRFLESQLTAETAGANDGSKRHSDQDDDDSDAEVAGAENGEVKPKKQKKPKKPKVTVAEAAAKIDADNLSAFIIDINVSATEFLKNYSVPHTLICWLIRESWVQFRVFDIVLGVSLLLLGFLRIATRYTANAIRRLLWARIRVGERSSISVVEDIQRVQCCKAC